MATNFKYIPYRNKKILAFAEGQTCQHCGTCDGTVVMAHSNLIADGKGVGKKADDCFVALLCQKCHEQYDQKHGLDQVDFDQAMKRTWKLLLTKSILK